MSVENKVVDLAVAIEIEDFLSGKTDGHDLFQRLYGATAEEPIPERLLAIVRGDCEAAAADIVEASPAPVVRLSVAAS
jgi:hypothetical protein